MIEHSLMHKLLTEHQLCARDCSRCLRYTVNKDLDVGLTYSPAGGDGQQAVDIISK